VTGFVEADETEPLAESFAAADAEGRVET
jgi:hypothetical protein